MIIILIRPKRVIFTQILQLTICTIFIHFLLYTTPTSFDHIYIYIYWPSSGSDNSRLRVQHIWFKHVEVVYNNKYKNIVQLIGGNICYVLDFKRKMYNIKYEIFIQTVTFILCTKCFSPML